jgi:hypothetical protein
VISVDALTRLLVRWPQEVFESHRIVFTVGTSVASILTAWAGTLLPSFLQLHTLAVQRLL